MTGPDNKQLRELVNDHYHGLITPESYRQQRAELLDNLGRSVAGDATAAPKTPQRAPRTPDENTRRKSNGVSSVLQNTRGLAIGGVAVIGVGIAVVLLVRTPDQDRDAGTPPPQDETRTEVTSTPGDSLLRDFLSRNDWSGSSLANLAATWRTLDGQQHESAREGPQFRRLASALNQRLREESALATAESEARVIALTEFAAAMSIAYREPQIARNELQSAPDVVPDMAGELEVEFPEDSADTTTTDMSESVSPDVAELPREAAVDDRAAITAVEEAVTETTPGREEEPETVVESRPTPATETAASTDEVSTVAPNDPCPAEIANSRRPYCQDLLTNGGKGPPLVVLQGGEFEMGSSRYATESPTHPVNIDGEIAMSRYEITVGEYEQYCAATSLPCPDRKWDGDDYPIVSVSWDDAVLYTQWMSEATGFKYRLPSEAEWEFAARAGTQTPYSFGDDITPSSARSMVNGQAESPLPRSDRTVNRNPFRLYHMSGNIREWVQDSWYANYDNAPGSAVARVDEAEARHVVRGGSYADPGTNLRSAAREPLDHAHRDTATGFRIVREIAK